MAVILDSITLNLLKTNELKLLTGGKTQEARDTLGADHLISRGGVGLFLKNIICFDFQCKNKLLLRTK